MINTDTYKQLDSRFLGLAPFLRQNLAGVDLLPIGQELLNELGKQPDNAYLWMNLSTIMLCLGQRDIGLAMQYQALQLQRIYTLSARLQPIKLRVLLIMMPGDLAANTPLDCLLENTHIDLIYYYISADNPLALPIPEHDVVVVAISEADESVLPLASLELALMNWPKPLVNPPHLIPEVGRCQAAQSFQGISGLLAPLVHRVVRGLLQSIAAGQLKLSQALVACDFPIIIRPTGSHAGRDLAKLENTDELLVYLARVTSPELFLSQFVDYRSEDGLFRKYRIALVEGQPFACHMAISDNWLIHYVNAGMYEDAGKRQQEADFMTEFDTFRQKHQLALQAIYARIGLDYFGIDCAETQAGDLLIFEIDHAMVVHAMDSEDLFPHKQVHMKKLQDAFSAMLFRLSGNKAIS